MSVPEERESTPQSDRQLTDVVQGGEPIDILAHLRQQPSPATTFQLLKEAVHGYSPISILSQLTNRFLFVRRDEFHRDTRGSELSLRV